MPDNTELFDKYYRGIVRCLDLIDLETDADENWNWDANIWEIMPSLTKIFEQAEKDGYPIDYCPEGAQPVLQLLLKKIMDIHSAREEIKDQIFKSGDVKRCLNISANDMFERGGRLGWSPKSSMNMQRLEDLDGIQSRLKKLAYKAIDNGADMVIGGITDDSPLGKAVYNSRYTYHMEDIVNYALTHDRFHGRRVTEKQLDEWLKEYIQECLKDEFDIQTARTIDMLCFHGADPYRAVGGKMGFHEIVAKTYPEGWAGVKKLPQKTRDRIKHLRTIVKEYDPKAERNVLDMALRKIRGLMQRVKYRGKAIVQDESGKIKKGDWVKGPLLLVGKAASIITTQKTPEDYRHVKILVDPETLGQFVGARYQDGREMYENDIVHLNGGHTVVVKWAGNNTPVLINKQEYAELQEFMQSHPNISEGDAILKLFAHKPGFITNCTVNAIESMHYMRYLGNIHDNPELMEIKTPEQSQSQNRTDTGVHEYEDPEAYDYSSFMFDDK